MQPRPRIEYTQTNQSPLNVLLSIIPNSIHPKPRLLNIQMRHPAEQFILPPIHLHPPLLIIAQRKPLIAPGTRTHGVGMAATRRRGIETDLPLDLALLAQFKRCNIPRQLRAVGSRGCEEVFPAMRAEDDVRAVHFRVEMAEVRGDKWVVCSRVDGHVGVFVDYVHADSVAGFHEDVEVGVGRGDLDPAWMVAFGGRFNAADEGELACGHILGYVS